MDLQEFYKFANENPVAFLATVDGDQPHVRALMMDKADETGFYFSMGIEKPMYHQLCANPKVEVCFFHQGADFGQVKQMRVWGVMEEVHDPALLESAYQARVGLEQIAGKSIKPLMVVFRLKPAEGHFWTIMNAMREAETLVYVKW